MPSTTQKQGPKASPKGGERSKVISACFISLGRNQLLQLNILGGVGGWAANKNQVEELLKAIGLFAGHRSAWIYPGAKGQPNTADLKVNIIFF